MPERTIAELLSPAALARIDDYAFLARVVVEGFVSGLHRSLYQGFGSEFFQYRSYVPGDDPKYVDWKVYGRRDKFFTKMFQEETNMNCSIILDASASMGYQGTQAPCSKLRYACMVAACLAYLTTRQGDNIGFHAYNENVVSSIAPGHRTGGLQRILTELYRIKPQGVANHGPVLNYLAENFQRRGLIVLLSDLLDAEDVLETLLKRFRFAHHECVVFQILDQDEVDFPFARTTRFVDSETGATITTAPSLVQQSFVKSMSELINRARLMCFEQQVDYLTVRTSDNLGNMLAAYLHRRESFK